MMKINLSNRARRVCVFFALLFLGIFLLYKVINPTLSLYGVVVAKHDGDITIKVTKEIFDFEQTIYNEGGQKYRDAMDIKEGNGVNIYRTDISDRLYNSLSLGDEIKANYIAEYIPNPDGVWGLSSATSIRKALRPHPFPNSFAGMDLSEQEEDRIEELSTRNRQEDIRAFVDYYNTERELLQCFTFVNSDIDGTFYCIHGYREDSGERYLSLVTETIDDGKITRTGDVYAFIEIREINGKETIVLSDEFDENQRYIPME